MKRRQILAWAVVLLVLAVPQTVLAEKVTLAWDPSVGSKVAGYRIYYSRDRGQYKKSRSINVGQVTSYTLNLPAGPWYLAVSAYDSRGHESGYSKPICWQCKSAPVKSESKIHAGGAAALVPLNHASAVADTATRLIPTQRNRPQRIAPRRDQPAPGKLIQPSVTYRNMK